jgi:hypothetical protein
MQRRRAAVTAGLALLAGRAVNPASPLPTLEPGLLTIGTCFRQPTLRVSPERQEDRIRG